MCAHPRMLILRLVMQIAVQAGSLKQIIQLSDEICNLPFLDILQEQVAFHFTTQDLQNAFKAMSVNLTLKSFTTIFQENKNVKK